MKVRWGCCSLILVCMVTLVIVCVSQKVFAAAPAQSLTTSPVTLGLNIKPGTSSTQTLKVMNNTAGPLPIVMHIETFGAHGSSGEAAISDFQPGDQAATWVHVSPSAFVAQPGVWSPVTATITLPKAASLGYYYAVVFQPTIASQPQTPKTAIVKGSNAILVLVDTGSANEQRQVEVANFSVSKKLYEYLPASFSVNIRNAGNIFLAPSGDIFISRNRNGTNTLDTLPINAGGGNVLPNSNRVFQADWTSGFPVFIPQTKDGQPVTVKGKPVLKLNWDFSKANKLRFGKYYARLAFTYNDGKRQILLNSVVSFWVVPWKLLIVVVIVGLLLLFGFWSIGRSMIRKIRGVRKKK